MAAPHRNPRTAGRAFWTIALLAVCIPCAVSPQQISDILFRENFESGSLHPDATVQTVGTFTVPPGVKDTGIFGSSKAFGFGKSDCNAGCWYGNTCTIRLEFPEPSAIGIISFREAELDGNYGSTGYVTVDGQVVEDGEFQRLPWNDLIADTTYREHVLVANVVGTVVEFRVIDITGTSEMFIDDILITNYKRTYDAVFSEYFDEPRLNPHMSVTRRGTFTVEPGFRNSTLFGGVPAWGFGRSDCRLDALDDYATSLTITLPDTCLIKAVQFREAEQDTNWGNQGLVYLDDHELPCSAFGRMPSNDSGVDTGVRVHYLPVNQRGRRITFRVWDITSLGEILLDDVIVWAADPKGVPILVEDFEDGLTGPDFSMITQGTFIVDPGIKGTVGLGGERAWGFGKSTCTGWCLRDFQSVLVIRLPEDRPLAFVSFKAMELDGNYGSSGVFTVNDEVWPGMDFSRLPTNDLTADTSFRSYWIRLDFPVHRIGWIVWDVANASEVFVDDIVLGALEGPVNVDGRTAAPDRFEILRNYPNPFNASTMIACSMPEPAAVVIDIFDAKGRVVDRMDLGKQPAGILRAKWDSSRFASGSYFCRVTTPATVRVMKMSLVR
jgi:hypothetical protein